MINYETILSSFDDKLTLMQWLQKVEEALLGAGLETVSIRQVTPTTAVFTFNFADGTSVTTPSITLPKGDKGDKGDTGNTGATGNGISSITKTGTSGLVDTYTIYYTNGTTQTFNVTNGANGADGADGADGVGISAVDIDASKHLIVTLTDSTEIDAGLLPYGSNVEANPTLSGSETVLDGIEIDSTKYSTRNPDIVRKSYGSGTITGTFTQAEYDHLKWEDGILWLQIGGNDAVVFRYETEDTTYLYYKDSTQYSLMRIKIDKTTRVWTYDTKYLTPFGDKVKSSSSGGVIATNGQVLTADGNGGASWQNASGGEVHQHFINIYRTVGTTYPKYSIALTIINNSATPMTSISDLKTYLNTMQGKDIMATGRIETGANTNIFSIVVMARRLTTDDITFHIIKTDGSFEAINYSSLSGTPTFIDNVI